MNFNPIVVFSVCYLLIIYYINTVLQLIVSTVQCNYTLFFVINIVNKSILKDFL